MTQAQPPIPVATPNFSEIEERTFVLLDNAEKSHAQVGALIDKLTALVERLEQAEKQREQKFAEVEKQANANEQARQKAWEQWTTEQSQRWQEAHQHSLTDWQDKQKQQWQTWQSQVEISWQYWRNEQQSKMLTEIKTVTQSAANIITKLDDKVKTVNLTAQNVNTLIENGTAQAITALVADQLKQTVSNSLTGITAHLNLTNTTLQNTQATAQQLHTTLVDLNSQTFDTLQNKVATQVKHGVEKGLTAGLADSSEKINSSLTDIKTKSVEVQNDLISEFKKNIKQATQEANTAKQSVLNDIYTSHTLVKDNSDECIQSLQKVKAVADESVADVKQYHADLVNKGHKRWVLGWTALLTLLVTSSGVITYKLNQPDYVERDRIANDIIMLLQQKSAIENSYTLQKTKAQNGKFYTLIDKSDCIEGDYCRPKEPSSYTNPTIQQLTPPQPITPPVSQSNQNTQSTSGYQSSKNMYSDTQGANGNPFGNAKYDPNPYKNP